MIFYNFHIFPLLVIGVISGRIAIKFKTDIKDAIKSIILCTNKTPKTDQPAHPDGTPAPPIFNNNNNMY